MEHAEINNSESNAEAQVEADGAAEAQPTSLAEKPDEDDHDDSVGNDTADGLNPANTDLANDTNDENAQPCEKSPDTQVETAITLDNKKEDSKVRTSSEATSAGQLPPSASATPPTPMLPKKKPEDFVFLKIIGEGSFSTVHKAKELSSDELFAIKVCEKSFIVRQRKQEYIFREKDVMSRLNHPFCVRLYYTFQDVERLYFALTFCPNGDLLEHLRRLKTFSIECTQFYTAEIVSALEYLHGIHIIHRDLKPENILLGDDFHIRITDFGSSKDMTPESSNKRSTVPAGSSPKQLVPSHTRERRNSFVGTPQFVSPEVLESQPPTYSSDLWALGCILYQLHTGVMPFDPKDVRSHEYEIFQNIIKVNYTFTEDFDPDIKDVVEQLIVREPNERLGCEAAGGWHRLKSHRFFTGISFSQLPHLKPPPLGTLKPAQSVLSLILDHEAGLTESVMTKLLEKRVKQEWGSLPSLDEANDNTVHAAPTTAPSVSNTTRRSAVSITDMLRMSPGERAQVLDAQKTSLYHEFAKDQLILKQGILCKRKPPKGMKWKKRMFLLLEGPRLLYIDPRTRVIKGEMTWSREVRPEAKNFEKFYIHSRGRTYQLEAPNNDAPAWCDSIVQVWQHYYGPPTG